MRADCFEHSERFRVAIDRVLQLGAGETDGSRVDEDRRDTRVDHRRFECPNARHDEIINQVTSGEHRTALRTGFFRSRIHEFELHFGGGERDAIEFKIARFLHRAVGYRHMRDDGLPYVLLPDADRGDAIGWYA